MRSGRSISSLAALFCAVGALGPEIGPTRNEFSERIAEIQDEDEKKRALAKAAEKRARKGFRRKLLEVVSHRRSS